MTWVVGLMAVLVPASVALVGHWYTRQSDRRLAQEREEAAERRNQDHREEAARLRLDAAMRAASLFDGRKDVTSSASSASGLLALTELGQADLAVALLVDLWSDDRDSHADHRPDRDGCQVSNETAILVINAALKDEESITTPLVAAELLCRNAGRLNPCQSLHWPAAIDGCWIASLNPRAKLLLIDGLVLMTIGVDATENALRSLIVRLYGIWNGDPNLRVKGCVGTLIAALIPALEGLDYSEFMQGTETVKLQQLRQAASSASLNPDGYLERMVKNRSERLADWSHGCQECSHDPGALGTAHHQI